MEVGAIGKIKWAAVAAVGIATITAVPALAGANPLATQLHEVGNPDRRIDCVAWQEPDGSRLLCGQGWRYLGHVLVKANGTRWPAGLMNDGPSAGQVIAPWGGCELGGVTKVIWKVSDLDRSDGNWEARGVYRCT